VGSADIVAAVRPVIRAFSQLGIPYEIGGSVASSACGIPRTTLDVDLVTELRPDHVDALVAAVQQEYYVDACAVREAIDHHACFNLIHLETMLKVDVFILKSRRYDQEAFQRRKKDLLGVAPDSDEFYFASPEDVVLNKLEWFRMGNRVSERQWMDVMGVIKVQGDVLDVEYLRKWAKDLEVADLLEDALHEARSPDQAPTSTTPMNPMNPIPE